MKLAVVFYNVRLGPYSTIVLVGVSDIFLLQANATREALFPDCMPLDGPRGERCIEFVPDTDMTDPLPPVCVPMTCSSAGALLVNGAPCNPGVDNSCKADLRRLSI